MADGIRERYPPHDHVALFPDAYMASIAPLLEAERVAERVDVLADRFERLAAGVFDLDAARGRGALWRGLGLVPLDFGIVLILGRAAGKRIGH